jgi:hypothetical protein
MANATAILDYRVDVEGGFIVAVKVWLVPTPVLGSTHSFKYSLIFGRPGERLVGYDNERGKGDHRHHGRSEKPYVFASIEKLTADFGADIERVKGSLW